MNFDIKLVEIVNIVFSFALVLSVWRFIKPKYKRLHEAKLDKLDYLRFKRNFKIFSSLLTSKNPLDTDIYGLDEIILGNKKAKLNILIVTNPFCGHCKEVHNILRDLLSKHSEQIKIILRFNINLVKKRSEVVKLCSNLHYIYRNSPDKILKALDDAYVFSTFNEWIKKWGQENIDYDSFNNIFEKQKKWCISNNINFTPFISINGYEYPQEYERNDIKFFIEDLIYNNNKIFKIGKKLERVI